MVTWLHVMINYVWTLLINFVERNRIDDLQMCYILQLSNSSLDVPL